MRFAIGRSCATNGEEAMTFTIVVLAAGLSLLLFALLVTLKRER
jgi:hypothetical protein